MINFVGLAIVIGCIIAIGLLPIVIIFQQAQITNIHNWGNSTTTDPPVQSFTTWTITGFTATVSYSSSDYNLWVYPYLPQLERIRQVLMTPYNPGQQNYGYDSQLGIDCGANIEASPAIGVSAGYNDACAVIDNNLEGGCALDYFNSLQGVITNICGKVRQYLSESWFGVGGCSSPFPGVTYPSSFPLLDRREGEYGFSDPYASIMSQPGVHLGGIGSSCGTGGQVWYLAGYDNPSSTMIVTEMPGSQIAATGDLEELSFYIDEAYMQCVSKTASCLLWQDAYLNAMSQYPFAAPRQALHFIQCTRATVAWNDSFAVFNGMNASTMLQNTINQIFTQAVGSDGGLYQQWNGGGSSDTPEPNMQAMIAFDPEMPSWFVA